MLAAPNTAHLTELMTWFRSESNLRDWGGPNVRYPLDLTRFEQDLNLDSLDSFVLLSDRGDAVAFGQCYRRLGHCHLARLAVAPAERGKGIIALLVEQLTQFGRAKFRTDSSSLFVLKHNFAAIKAYQRLGYEYRVYPEKIPFDDCLYRVKEHAN